MPPLIMCRYNGVIPYNMPLLTTNIRIVSVSFPYRFRIVSVSFPYCFRIVSVSFSYWEAETIRNRTNDKRWNKGG